MTELEILQARNLALIAENERLDRESQNLSDQLGSCDRDRRAIRDERDQLKAENERLAIQAEACQISARIHQGESADNWEEVKRLKAENEALRGDAERVASMAPSLIRTIYNDAYYAPREIGSDAEQIRAGVLAVLRAAKEARS